MTVPYKYVDIPEWPGYRVTRDGHVESCRTFQGGIGSTWRRLKPRADKDGYLSVTLQQKGVKKTVKVAHLVLEAFVAPRPPGAVACHRPDPDITNNAASNLAWDTQQGNINDKIAIGSQAAGERHGMAKLTDAQVAEIRARYRPGRSRWNPSNAGQLAEEFGVTYGRIHYIGKNESPNKSRKSPPAC